MPRNSNRNQAQKAPVPSEPVPSEPVPSEPVPSEPYDIFARARRLIHGQRQSDYGDKLENFSQIAAFWNATLARKLSVQITPADVGQMMIGLKLARLSKSPTHYDALLDVAGYAGCLEKLLEEEAFGKPLPGILDEITAPSFDRFGAMEAGCAQATEGNQR